MTTFNPNSCCVYACYQIVRTHVCQCYVYARISHGHTTLVMTTLNFQVTDCQLSALHKKCTDVCRMSGPSCESFSFSVEMLSSVFVKIYVTVFAKKANLWAMQTCGMRQNLHETADSRSCGLLHHWTYSVSPIFSPNLKLVLLSCV